MMVCNRGRCAARRYPDGKMTIPRKTQWVSALAVVVVFSAAAAACSVPTFRYALERWDADFYGALVFHRGELSKADQAVVKLLEEASDDSEEGAFTNVAVYTVDLADKEVDKKLLKLLPAAAQEKLPWMLVRYPRYHDIAKSLVSAPLSMAAAKKLLNSPMRAEIVKKLVAGETAVWVLLEGGNRKADDAAAKLLGGELKKLQATLKLPEHEPHPGDPMPAPKLRVAFSMVRLARNDPAEKMLVDILSRAEPGLTDAEYAGKPMAMPIFGRARAMYALVGDGINDENIAEACYILVAPCSCRIKQALTGTGIDLLATADWIAAIEGVMHSTELTLPPLTGMSTTAPATVPTRPTSAPTTLPTRLTAAPAALPDTDKGLGWGAASEAAPRSSIVPRRHSSLLWYVLAAVGVVVVAVVVVGLVVALKSPKPQR